MDAPDHGGRGFRHRLGSTSIALWGSTALGFIGTVAAARVLGPGEYGIVVLALATATLISTLLDLTLEQGVVHHGSRALADEDIGGLRELVRWAFALDIGIGVVVAGGMFVLAGPIAELLGHGHLDASIMRIASLNVLAATLDGTTGGVLQLVQRPELRAWAMAWTNITRLAAMLLVLALGATTAEPVLAAYAAGTAVGGVFQTFLAWRMGWRKWHAPRVQAGFRRSAGKLLPFAVHSSLSTTLSSATDSLIILFLGRFSGPTAVAFFRIARLPELGASLATAPIRLVMFPENAKSFATGRIDQLARVLYRWSAISLAIALPAAVVGWVVMPELITAIYGERFADAASAARILLVTAVLLFTFPWMKTFAAVIGRPQIASKLGALLLVVALPITVVFGAEHGQDAAAAGVSCGVAAMTAGYLWVAWRFFKRHRAQQGRLPAEGRSAYQGG